jgi:hypothetical protein
LVVVCPYNEIHMPKWFCCPFPYKGRKEICRRNLSHKSSSSIYLTAQQWKNERNNFSLNNMNSITMF